MDDSRQIIASPRLLPTAPEHSRESAQEQILVALMNMAAFRGAAATEEYLLGFSQRLSLEHLPGVLEACRRLGERPVREGEKALPDLGTILAARPIRDTWE